MAKPNQTAAVIAEVLQRIEDGALMPGAPIDERNLMERCNVSRTPIREALIQLEAGGLIVRHPRKGAHLFRPTTDEFLAILEIHTNLEAHAAELAAQRMLPAAEAELRGAVAACSEFAASAPVSEPARYYALNLEFHRIIAEAAGNPFLTDMIKMNARKLMTHYRLRYRTPGAVQASAREHEEIAMHILARDPAKARACMIRHFNYDRETVMHMIASVQ